MMRLARVTALATAFAVTTFSIVGGASEGPSPYAAWSFGAFGTNPGAGGIVVARVDGQSEIILDGGLGGNVPGRFWYAVRYSATTGQYEQTFISEMTPSPIVRISFLRTTSNERPITISVALTDGTVQLHDLRSKALLGTRVGPCYGRDGLVAEQTTDVNSDGWDEFVSLCGDGSVAVDGYNYTLWQITPAARTPVSDLAVGQMDDDPGLEIATTDGRVIDIDSNTVQWTRADGFWSHLCAADIDGDGRAELIVGDPSGFIRTYDVEEHQEKAAFEGPLGIDTLTVADVDRDGLSELLVGETGFGKVRAYDPLTFSEKWAIRNGQAEVTRIAIGDVNDDGVNEIIWGAGATRTGPHRLYIGNWVSQAIEWENEQLDGPFLGPALGDLDGDGVPELVLMSTSANAGHDSGRIVVLDSRTLKVRAISPSIAGGTNALTGAHDFKLRDLNGDGRLEIVVAADWAYDGLIEAYSFSPGGDFTLVWTNPTRPHEAAFHSVEVADVDGDGHLEVIAAGGFVHVYDVETGVEEWTEGGQWKTFNVVLVGQFDDDPNLELAAFDNNEIYTYDGVTHAAGPVIGRVSPQVSALAELDPRYGLGQWLIGDWTQGVYALRYDRLTSAYVTSAFWTMGDGFIMSVALTEDGALAVVSDGSLIVRREGKFFETGQYLLQSGPILSMGGGRVLLSAGYAGVHAFIVR